MKIGYSIEPCIISDTRYQKGLLKLLWPLFSNDTSPRPGQCEVLNQAGQLSGWAPGASKTPRSEPLSNSPKGTNHDNRQLPPHLLTRIAIEGPLTSNK